MEDDPGCVTNPGCLKEVHRTEDYRLAEGMLRVEFNYIRDTRISVLGNFDSRGGN